MDDNKSFWQRCARFYGPIQQRSNRRLYKELANMCRAYIAPDAHVLELACGTGQFTYPLCDLCESWEATDFSQAMIAEAEKKPCSAHFSVQDATHLPYSGGSFDLVLIANALHIMPAPQLALSEIHRVLKPGGILLAPTFVYEGKVNRFRMWLTTMVGFKTFHHWKSHELCQFTESERFRCMSCELVPGDPLPVAFAVFRKI